MATRVPIVFEASRNRVILKRFFPSSLFIAEGIVKRIASKSRVELEETWMFIEKLFSHRHFNLRSFLLMRGAEVLQRLNIDPPAEEFHLGVVGSFFVHEYAIEAAALFNPSMVLHPDQTDLSPGAQRYIVSLRSCGEGHISSIRFAEIVVLADDQIIFPDDEILQPLSTGEVIAEARGLHWNPITGHEFVVETTDFRIVFDSSQTKLPQRIIFPCAPSQSNGIEDARFVKFEDFDSNSVTYYATYTAYDGRAILPQLIITTDFVDFEFVTLRGRGISNKGMALFPRKVNGHYVMLSRQDDVTTRIMFSNSLLDWNESAVLIEAEQLWESFKMGNCGSPIETPQGWIVITHGVGPMRRYSIGAALLDLKDPTKVLARLKEPLISPNEVEREGYVPNVVYSCGSILRGDTLIIPYAMSDSRWSIAQVKVSELMKQFSTCE